MITASGFGKKVLFVILMLIGLNVIQSFFPLLLVFTHVNPVIYYNFFQPATYASGAVMGVILGLQGRMPVLQLISLVVLGAFYPAGAGILYLMLILLQHNHEP